MNKNRLKKILDNFSGKRVLVLGDIILDEYIFGKVSRLSPEAPVPIVEVESRESIPGGAAYVSSHIANLGGKALLSGVIGRDEHGKILKRNLAGKGVELAGVVEAKDRQTILKTRIIAQRQQMVRIDSEKKAAVDAETARAIISFVESVIDSVDSLIISDYGKGVVIPSIFKQVIGMAGKRKIPVAVDPKPTHCLMYKGVTVITPNTKEASESVHIEIKDEESLLKAGKELLGRVGCESVLITRGEHGMSLFRRGKVPLHIPTFAQEVFDVTGAGDTVISVLALSLAAGANLAEASYLANVAAGVVVGKLGAASVSLDEIKKMLKASTKS